MIDDTWIGELPALVRAAARGDVDEAAELLRTGIDPDQADDDGWTALHAAAVFNHLQIVRDLLHAGADVEARDKGGFTPLLNAAQANVEVVNALLLDTGVEVDARDFSGGTALMDAAEAGSAACVALLLQAGADPLLSCDGETAAMLAKKHGHHAVAELLATSQPTNDEASLNNTANQRQARSFSLPVRTSR